MFDYESLATTHHAVNKLYYIITAQHYIKQHKRTNKDLTGLNADSNTVRATGVRHYLALTQCFKSRQTIIPDFGHRGKLLKIQEAETNFSTQNVLSSDTTRLIFMMLK